MEGSYHEAKRDPLEAARVSEVRQRNNYGGLFQSIVFLKSHFILNYKNLMEK